MTLLQTIRRLQKLLDKHGNCQVDVDWHAMRERAGGLAEDCSHLRIDSIAYELVNVADGDGGSQMNKDGTERTIRTVTIR